MDVLNKDASASDAVPQQQDKASARRNLEYWIAFVIVGAALEVSPLAIRMLTHRTELSLHLLVPSVVFNLFLLLVAGALLTRRKLRRFFFHLIAWTLPVVAIAGLEVVAGKVRLSQHVAMFEDLSVIKRGSGFEPDTNHRAPEKDGFAVYRPWSGNGVTINGFGLRTSPPTPKAQGEYRVAAVGSSETFGARLAEADTIPSLLQAALHRNGHDEISVYNFGIEGANIDSDLALLRHFKEIYGIDQAIFIIGGAETWAVNSAVARPPLTDGIASFELYKAIHFIMATWFEPSPARLAQFDAQYQALPADTKNRLIDGIKTANDYCKSASLRCDFILQPQLGTRRPPRGTEVQLAQTTGRLCPRCVVLAAQMYRDALDLGPSGQVHDFTTVFDQSSDQFYFDVGHVNEGGSAIIADALLPVVLRAALSK